MNPEMKPPYAVIACRWGWSNNGFSVICVTKDFDRACMEARDYADYRGGKYGCGVFDQQGNQVYHAASLYGEDRLHTNHRIDAFETVGNHVCCAIESGKELTQEEIREKWQEAERMQRFYEEMDEKIHAKAAAPTA